MFRLPGLFVKQHVYEGSAKREVMMANMLRLLGHPEVPRHRYARDEKGNHYSVSDEVKDAEPLNLTRIKSHDAQRIVDLLGAERFVGVRDRHKGNYLLDPAGTLRPIDFGINGRGSNHIGTHALGDLLDYDVGHRVSEHQARLMRKYLRPLGALWKKHAVHDWIPRYVKLQGVLRRQAPPSLGDLE